MQIDNKSNLKCTPLLPAEFAVKFEINDSIGTISGFCMRMCPVQIQSKVVGSKRTTHNPLGFNCFTLESEPAIII